ncbi:MAG: hypothetical protein HY040_04080 [Planctomycetes bacterium]|nr:hypothetical protein [Planctomycetota bacterium]
MDDNKHDVDYTWRYLRRLLMFAIAGTLSGAAASCLGTVAACLGAIVQVTDTHWDFLRNLWDAGETSELLRYVFGFAKFREMALAGAFLGVIGGVITHVISKSWSRSWRVYGVIALWAVVGGSLLLATALPLNPQRGTLVAIFGFGTGACYGALLGLFVRLADWLSDRLLLCAQNKNIQGDNNVSRTI